MTDDYQKKRQGKKGKGKVEAIYYYHDESGVTLFRNVRTRDKDGNKSFYLERYIGPPDKYEPGLKGQRTVLYNLPEVNKAETVWVFEGEKDVENFRALLEPDEASTTNPMGALKWKPEYGDTLKGKQVFIVQDKDEVGMKHAQLIVKDIKHKAKSVKVINVSGPPEVKDFSDWLHLNISMPPLPPWSGKRPEPDWDLDPRVVIRKFLNVLILGAEEQAVRPLSEVLDDIVMRCRDFLELDLPPRVTLMEPWLEEASYGLISSKPGCGKTWLAMEIASALSNGRNSMEDLWRVNQPVPVLYIDGEMHWADLWDRIRQLKLSDGYILSKTLYDRQANDYDLNLADPYIRKELMTFILSRGCKLVILDNIFSLVHGIDTNSDKDWSPINQWCLKLSRANGVSMILIHHTGKSGTQLGTASRVFNTDWSLLLHKKESESGEDPCCFRISIDKERGQMPGLTGRWFQCINGRWTVTSDKEARIEDAKDRLMSVCEMLVEDEMSQANIAANLDVGAPAVSIKIKQALALNLIEKIEHGKYKWTDYGKKRFEERK